MKASKTIKRIAQILLDNIDQDEKFMPVSGLCVLTYDLTLGSNSTLTEVEEKIFDKFVDKYQIKYKQMMHLFKPYRTAPRVRFLKAIINEERYVYDYDK